MLATVPLKRAGTPEEIAEAIVFVASEKASFMTGEILRVNGGRTAA
jgi:NAD(P)-dependent dehydrogenase (short-subunit alcohol dehydrogenase family)